MPEPVGRSERYMPGLDGLRAVAVLAVVAFHLGFEWAPGGLLGVGVFFTLSGYLITDILLNQLARRGHIKLLSFWAARARRLLPALFLMLAVVVAWVTLLGPPQSPKFRDSVLPAIFYVSNWWLIFEQVSYFADFAPPAPFNHLWSLAVEEQFYIVWPFLLLAGTKLVRETPLPSGIRPRLAALTAGLAVVSAVVMAVLYEPSLDPSRVYYGTDTRAAELLVGAALAMVWPSRKLTRAVTAGARRLLDGMGVVGLAVILLMVWRTSQYDSFLYRGGFLLLALATALLVAALAHPACRLGAVVGWGPLRWIGVRSYGIYLWHFPIIVLTTPTGAESGNDLVRDLLQSAAILAVAALSWRYVEEPIRRGALGRLWRATRSGALRWDAVPRGAWAAVGSGVVVLMVAIAGMAGAGPGEASEAEIPGAGGEESRTAHAKAPSTAALPGQSACRAVIHIGDSTSEGLTSDNYLPRPSDRIDAQYARVGARVQHIEISGARSIVETFEGEPNAEEVARTWKADGYDGCWVLALGTNDSANVFVSDRTDERERIDLMMRAIGDQPVLWVNVKSLVESGPYAAENMRAWDRALLAACPRYPDMRVFDWAAAVRDEWFIDDGIHFTTPGYRARSRMIADALAEAFPAGGAAPRGSCLIEPPPRPQRPRSPRRPAAR
jgi:peptidoglycan/LPS O-acetylase OafA/YrhL